MCLFLTLFFLFFQFLQPTSYVKREVDAFSRVVVAIVMKRQAKKACEGEKYIYIFCSAVASRQEKTKWPDGW